MPINSEYDLTGFGGDGTYIDKPIQYFVTPTGNSNGLSTTLFNLYSGTTAPATYLLKFLPIVLLTGNTTINSTYVGKLIQCTGTFTLTLPNGMIIGMQINILNVGSGTITIAATGTLNSKNSANKLVSQYGGASAYYRATNVWILVGDITT